MPYSLTADRAPRPDSAPIGDSIPVKRALVESPDPVTLVGGGALGTRDLAMACRRAPVIVAADSGADRVLAAGLMPSAVIGDFDSISPHARATIPADRLHLIAEQETTDFDKALRMIAAPFVLAVGFTGARIDHGLAVFNTLVSHPGRRCVVLGGQDVIFACPPAVELALRLVPGDRVSLFPMAPVQGRSDGLEWPIAGLEFTPSGRIGTSNRAVSRDVRLAFDGPGMLVILPRNRLDAALRGLCG